jgi:hypothetical protein
MAKVDPEATPSSLWLFILKFFLAIVVLLAIWWPLGVPAYGWLLGKICALITRTFLGMPIEASFIIPQGLFNTDSLLEFTVGEHRPAMPIALLITNLPPFVALVLATPRIALRRRVRILAIGCGILIAGHIAFICTLLRFQESLQAHPQIPIAVIQFFLTLPFLLWITLAYWRRIAALMNEKG